MKTSIHYLTNNRRIIRDQKKVDVLWKIDNICGQC